jgi:hypothetical protein
VNLCLKSAERRRYRLQTDVLIDEEAEVISRQQKLFTIALKGLRSYRAFREKAEGVEVGQNALKPGNLYAEKEDHGR